MDTDSMHLRTIALLASGLPFLPKFYKEKGNSFPACVHSTNVYCTSAICRCFTRKAMSKSNKVPDS